MGSDVHWRRWQACQRWNRAGEGKGSCNHLHEGIGCHRDQTFREESGDREVQRTMLELLNQLDGFSSDEGIKVCQLLHIIRL